MQFELTPLSQAEISEYLDFRMVTAGGKPGLFSEEAVAALYSYSNGTPRMINHAASLALLECFGRGETRIEQSVVDAVMLELGGNWE